MKILSSLRYRFSILAVLTVFLFAIASTDVRAQNLVVHTPFNNGSYESFSQMWNTNSSTWYYGTVTFGSSGTPNSSNWGSQKDTGASGGNLALSTSYLTAGYVNKDTAILQAVPCCGGYTTITATVLKVSGTATVTATLASSSDGFVWGKVPGATVYTFVPTSLTTYSVSTTGKWLLSTPLDRYYQVQFGGDGTNPYMAQAQVDYQRVFNISTQR